MAEWAQHPQCAAVASLPLLEIHKIGTARRNRFPVDRALCRACACWTSPVSWPAPLAPAPWRNTGQMCSTSQAAISPAAVQRNTTPDTGTFRLTWTYVRQEMRIRYGHWRAAPTCSLKVIDQAPSTRGGFARRLGPVASRNSLRFAVSLWAGGAVGRGKRV